MDLRQPSVSPQRSPPRRSSRAPVSLTFRCDPRLLERSVAFQPRPSPPSHLQPSFPASRAQNLVDNRPGLLARRVLTLEAFTAEIMNANGMQNKHHGKPIPVPLQPGESVGDYERRFFEWLHTKKARIDTASKERILRFQFAYSRLPYSAGKQMPKTSVHVDSPGKYGGTANKFGDAHSKNVEAHSYSKYGIAHSNYGEVSTGYAETHMKYDEAYSNCSDVKVPLKLARALSLKRKLANTQELRTEAVEMKRKRRVPRDPRLRSEDRVHASETAINEEAPARKTAHIPTTTSNSPREEPLTFTRVSQVPPIMQAETAALCAGAEVLPNAASRGHLQDASKKIPPTQDSLAGTSGQDVSRLARGELTVSSKQTLLTQEEDDPNVLPNRVTLPTKAHQVAASTFATASRNPEVVALRQSSAHEQTQTGSLTFSPNFSTEQTDLIAQPSAQSLTPSENIDTTQQEKIECVKQPPQSWTQNLAGSKLPPFPAVATEKQLDSPLTSGLPQQDNIDCPNNVIADTHTGYDQVIPSWAQALVQRVESLEEEVKQLRQELAASTKAGVASIGMSESNGVQQEITTEGGEVEQDCERKRLETDFLDANDEILLNDRAVNESEVLVLDLMGTQPQQAQELQSQIEEMRVAIAAESAKRDAALANLIAYSWGDKMQEFRELAHVSQLENVPATTLSSPPTQQASHIKCQALWSKLKLQNRAVATHFRATASEDGEQKKQRLSLLLDAKAVREQTRRELEAEYVALFHSSERVRNLVAQLRAQQP